MTRLLQCSGFYVTEVFRMKLAILFALAGGLALFAVASAQSPTPLTTPSPAAGTATAAPTTPPTATPVPVAPTPALPPGALPESAFNFDIVREVVYELRANDGVVHYVTLSQDTAGVVRVRTSLFNFPAGSYTLLFHPSQSCASTAGTRPIDAFTLDRLGSLVLTFRNTNQLSLEGLSNARPFGIFDIDGNAFGLFRTDAVTNGTAIACAIVPPIEVPGAPATGSGPGLDGRTPLAWTGAAAGVVSLAMAAIHWRKRRG